MFTLRTCFASRRRGGWAGTRAVPNSTEPVDGPNGILIVENCLSLAPSPAFGAFGRRLLQRVTRSLNHFVVCRPLPCPRLGNLGSPVLKNGDRKLIRVSAGRRLVAPVLAAFEARHRKPTAACLLQPCQTFPHKHSHFLELVPFRHTPHWMVAHLPFEKSVTMDTSLGVLHSMQTK